MPEPIYSPGLEGIIAGETAVSSLAGGLQYRGYAVEELAEKSTFEDVAYLLLYGDLPRAVDLAAFRQRIGSYSLIHKGILDVLKVIPTAAPLMDIMRSGASMLAHWDPDQADNSHDANLRKAERLLAQLPVIMAARYRLAHGLEPVMADPKRTIASNILWMLSGEEPPASWVKAMDVSLILYAEHELNASTFTARVVASTLSDIHSAVTAAIGALKGPLHGGANERVMEVLDEVGSPERAEAWIRDALARKAKIMGFGHRVYKQGDPRATILKKYCQQLAAETGHDDLERVADTLERVVREQKNLPPNLDWPSARLYHYMHLPTELYTPLFVVSRVTGWCAHTIEQLENNRIIRPLARYTGPPSRKWKPLQERG